MEKELGKPKSMVDNEEAFTSWLAMRRTRGVNHPLMMRTQMAYIAALKSSQVMFAKEYAPYKRVFSISDPEDFAGIMAKIKINREAYANPSTYRKFSSAAALYHEFLKSMDERD